MYKRRRKIDNLMEGGTIISLSFIPLGPLTLLNFFARLTLIQLRSPHGLFPSSLPFSAWAFASPRLSPRASHMPMRAISASNTSPRLDQVLLSGNLTYRNR